MKTPRAGFSLLELMIVVGLMLVVTTIAVPNITTVLANARLRASMTSLSGVVQNTRMMAVKQNATISTRYTTINGGLLAYAKAAADTSSVVETDPQVQLQAPIEKYTAPTGVDAPAALTTSQLAFTPVTTDLSFNSRGLPCSYVSGVCTTKGFVYYFRDTTRPDGLGWAALSVSPAGRINRWFWSGEVWVN